MLGRVLWLTGDGVKSNEFRLEMECDRVTTREVGEPLRFGTLMMRLLNDGVGSGDVAMNSVL